MALPLSIQLLGGDCTTADALRSIPAELDATGMVVVGEGCLDLAAGEEVRRRLTAGAVVVVLAQVDSSAVFYPVPVSFAAAPPGPQPHFTVDRGVLPSLVAGDLRVATLVAGRGLFPDRVVVGSPFGTAVGSHQVGPGRLVFCQFALCAAAAQCDGVGRAVLADLITWALVPRLTLAVEESRHGDDRRVARYSHTWTVAR